MKCVLFSTLFLLLFACSEKTENSKPSADSTNTVKAIDSSKTLTQDTPKDPLDLETFHNIEQMEYCLAYPAKEYAHNDSASDVRAKHVFTHKTKKNNELIMQGIYLSEKMPIEIYFSQAYTEEDEAEGKIVEYKQLEKDKSCFWAKGYWSNSIMEYRFIEMGWLEEDELVRYTINYDVKDTILWTKRLKSILAQGARCP